MSDTQYPLSYGPYRLQVSGTLHLLSPFHIGSGERLSVITDAPVVRLANLPTGRPFIRASSLRGVLRSRLRREQTQIGFSAAYLETCFGPATGNDGFLGRLRFFDCLPLKDVPLSLIRDHVRHSAETGAAADGAKFDREVVLPAPYSFRLLYYGQTKDDPELQVLRAIVELLKNKRVRVGAKAGSDHGRLDLKEEKWEAFDRQDPAGLASFIAFRLPGVTKPAIVHAEAPGQAPSVPPTVAPDKDLDPESTLRVTLRLHFKGPVLVKAAFPKPVDPPPAPDADFGTLGRTVSNAVFVEIDSNGKPRPFLPEETVRGVLRTQAAWIVGSMQEHKDPTAAALTAAFDTLFGSKKTKNHEGGAGLLAIGSSTLIGEPKYIFLDHVAIDRIVSRAVDSKKFDTCGLDSPVFEISAAVTLRRDAMHHLRLFLYVIRDLMAGQLATGYATTRGFGAVARAAVCSTCLDLASDLTYQPSDKTALETSWYARRILTFENEGWSRLKDIGENLKYKTREAPLEK